MFQLLAKLRAKQTQLEGIRIHMSGCPSSCAQHFTADVGLKGVRVRRLMGTREGFDVFLGGGIGGEVRMALPYKLGVDVDQLPTLIEHVVAEYYLRHQPGETFSLYWRQRLREEAAAKVGADDYKPPLWICEGCRHRHLGEDPPIFCPSCAGLRRAFARIDEEPSPDERQGGPALEAQARPDGFMLAAEWESLPANAGAAVEVGGRQVALFRQGDAVLAIDNTCPHSGGPLAEGEFQQGIVTCPWHGWAFDARTGCSISPAGHGVARYETRIADGKVYVRRAGPPATAAGAPGERRMEP
jgi:nitrite reductase/ring-hydroxylating ferredoxin subunit